MIAFPEIETRALRCPSVPAPDEAARLSKIMDYAEPWSLNYFKLRKRLGKFRAGEFIDRITLETLLFG